MVRELKLQLNSLLTTDTEFKVSQGKVVLDTWRKISVFPWASSKFSINLLFSKQNSLQASSKGDEPKLGWKLHNPSPHNSEKQPFKIKAICILPWRKSAS